MWKDPQIRKLDRSGPAGVRSVPVVYPVWVTSSMSNGPTTLAVHTATAATAHPAPFGSGMTRMCAHSFLLDDMSRYCGVHRLPSCPLPSPDFDAACKPARNRVAIDRACPNPNFEFTLVVVPSPDIDELLLAFLRMHPDIHAIFLVFAVLWLRSPCRLQFFEEGEAQLEEAATLREEEPNLNVSRRHRTKAEVLKRLVRPRPIGFSSVEGVIVAEGRVRAEATERNGRSQGRHRRYRRTHRRRRTQRYPLRASRAGAREGERDIEGIIARRGRGVAYRGHIQGGIQGQVQGRVGIGVIATVEREQPRDTAITKLGGLAGGGRRGVAGEGVILGSISIGRGGNNRNGGRGGGWTFSGVGGGASNRNGIDNICSCNKTGVCMRGTLTAALTLVVGRGVPAEVAGNFKQAQATSRRSSRRLEPTQEFSVSLHKTPKKGGGRQTLSPTSRPVCVQIWPVPERTWCFLQLNLQTNPDARCLAGLPAVHSVAAAVVSVARRLRGCDRVAEQGIESTLYLGEKFLYTSKGLPGTSRAPFRGLEAQIHASTVFRATFSLA
ncbi:hypothetical protein C8R47DRAFT_1066414 [Mycena vitilis]|nr:hypothetical protein C8R47DRAFT_1066414 [Mycena vitilis]